MSGDYETVEACLFETQRLLDISQECVRELRAENARLRDYETAAGLLAVEKAELRRENERLHAEAAVGSAIQRACGELPHDFTIAIDLENGAGSVELLWEDERWEPDFDLTFADQINECINEAEMLTGDQWSKCKEYMQILRVSVTPLNSTDTEGRKDE